MSVRAAVARHVAGLRNTVGVAASSADAYCLCTYVIVRI